jgi:hypothetical protein
VDSKPLLSIGQYVTKLHQDDWTTEPSYSTSKLKTVDSKDQDKQGSSTISKPPTLRLASKQGGEARQEWSDVEEYDLSDNGLLDETFLSKQIDMRQQGQQSPARRNRRGRPQRQPSRLAQGDLSPRLFDDQPSLRFTSDRLASEDAGLSARRVSQSPRPVTEQPSLRFASNQPDGQEPRLTARRATRSPHPVATQPSLRFASEQTDKEGAGLSARGASRSPRPVANQASIRFAPDQVGSEDARVSARRASQSPRIIANQPSIRAVPDQVGSEDAGLPAQRSGLSPRRASRKPTALRPSVSMGNMLQPQDGAAEPPRPRRRREQGLVRGMSADGTAMAAMGAGGGMGPQAVTSPEGEGWGIPEQGELRTSRRVRRREQDKAYLRSDAPTANARTSNDTRMSNDTRVSNEGRGTDAEEEVEWWERPNTTSTGGAPVSFGQPGSNRRRRARE